MIDLGQIQTNDPPTKKPRGIFGLLSPTHCHYTSLSRLRWAAVFIGMCLYLLPTISDPTNSNTGNTAAQRAFKFTKEHARTSKIVYKNTAEHYTAQSFNQMMRDTGITMTGTAITHFPLSQIGDTLILHGTDLAIYQPFPSKTSTTRSKQSWHKRRNATSPVTLGQLGDTLIPSASSTRL